jgi:hypothetical protein
LLRPPRPLAGRPTEPAEFDAGRQPSKDHQWLKQSDIPKPGCISLETVATRWPHAPIFAERTAPSRRNGSVRGWPVAASQSRADLSSEEVRSRRPSGLNCASNTSLSWRNAATEASASGCIPNSGGAIDRNSCNVPAVGTIRGADQKAVMLQARERNQVGSRIAKIGMIPSKTYHLVSRGTELRKWLWTRWEIEMVGRGKSGSRFLVPQARTFAFVCCQ